MVGYGLAVALVNAALPAVAAAETRILALGDSLTAGYGLPAGEGFTFQLERALKAKGLDVRVINAGVSGDTTAGGLARLDWALAEKPDAAIVALGANDMLRGLDPKLAERNLDAILGKLKARGLPVLLAGMRAAPNLGREYAERFDAIYPALAKKFDAPLYPFFLEGVAAEPRLNLPDGMHPTAEGIARMVQRMLPYVERLIGQARLYVADRFAGELADMTTVLKEVTGVRDWVGTAGIGVLATGREYYDEPALAMMVVACEPEAYRLLPRLEHDTRPVKQAHERWMEHHHPTVALVHADPRATGVPALIEALAEDIGFVVGGLTASRGGFPQLAGKVSEGGMSGVMFAGDVAVATGLSQGCSPIGPIRRITECADNVIATIDDRPALDVFKEDIGELLARDLRRVAGYIHAALPVPGSDTGDYMVRNLTGIDPQRGMIAIGANIAVGDPILFVRRDRAAAEQDLDRMLRQIKQRAGGTPKGGIYVSCVARGPNLFGKDSQEMGRIKDALGDFPLVGFFANGEISHNRLYGYTGVLTLFL